MNPEQQPNQSEPVSPPESTPAEPIVVTSSVDEPVSSTPEATPDTSVAPSFSTTETTVVEPMPAENETQPQPVADPMSGMVLPPKKSNKKLLVVLGVIVGALLIVLGGAWGAYALWYNNPQKVVIDALNNLATAKDLKLTGSLVSEASTQKISLDLDAATNSNGQTSGTVGVSLMQADTTTKLSAQFASEKDKAYFKLQDVRAMLLKLYGTTSSSMIDQYFGSILKKIDGKWVVITSDDLKEFTSDDSSSKQLTCVETEIGKLNTDASKRNELTKAFNDNMFVTITDKGMEAVNGVNSNHYVLTFNEETFKKFVTAAKTTSSYKAIDMCTNGELTKSVDSESSQATTQTQPTYELWINNWSHEVTKIAVSDEDTSAKSTTKLALYPKTNTNPTVTIPTADTTYDDLKTEVQNLTTQLFGASSETVTYPIPSTSDSF